MPIDIDTVANYACKTGEGPLWHPREKKLYWSDIPTGRLFTFDPVAGGGNGGGDGGKGKSEKVYEGRPVGGFTVQSDGQLLLFRDGGNVVTWHEGEVTSTIIDKIEDEAGTRFNDVIADPEGRVFAGSMAVKRGGKVVRPGRLYRFEPDGSYKMVLDNVGLPNGMGFTPGAGGENGGGNGGGGQMAFTDSSNRVIWMFEYDRRDGKLSNGRKLISVPEGEGVPDGLCIDAGGHIWSARWDGHGVYQYDANGELVDKIELPTGKISSVTFAPRPDPTPDAEGEGRLVDMYVTSAGGDGEHPGKGPAGALFRLRPGQIGQPEHRSRIGV